MKPPWQLTPTELYSYHQAQVAQIADMLNTARATPTQQKQRQRHLERTGHRSAAGDERRLRILPVHAPGVPGVIPGTNPLAETLRRERKLDTDR